MAAESSSPSPDMKIIVTTLPDFGFSNLGISNWTEMVYIRGKFNEKYEQKMTFYVARGKAKMHSLSTSEVVEFEAGHLVTQPEGLECRLEVTEALKIYCKPS